MRVALLAARSVIPLSHREYEMLIGLESTPSSPQQPRCSAGASRDSAIPRTPMYALCAWAFPGRSRCPTTKP
jgi:hypothetical protein